MQPDRPLMTLGTPRHACHACGRCCTGRRIRLLDAEETRRIERYGATLGVEDPVVDGALRSHEGACVFLGPDRLCRIHARYGLEAKPLLCRRFPLQGLQTEGEVRVAVDPSCSSNWRSWEDGPIVAVDAGPAVPQRPLPPQERQIELVLMRLTLQDGASVATVLRALAQQPMDGDELPDGFAQRLIIRLKAAKLAEMLAHPDIGHLLRKDLAHLPVAVDALDPERPPAWAGALSPSADGLALELLRRMLFLRGAPLPPFAQGTATLVLAGAVGLGWADGRPEVFGPALAAWCHLLRGRALWLRMVPDPQTLRWLATGERGPEA